MADDANFPPEMSKEALTLGFDLLCTYARTISMLPLEEWRDALNHAETIGAVTDPTLLREYIYSDKPKILKDVIDAAIQLKAVVIKHQATIAKMREKEGGGL